MKIIVVTILIFLSLIISPSNCLKILANKNLGINEEDNLIAQNVRNYDQIPPSQFNTYYPVNSKFYIN